MSLCKLRQNFKHTWTLQELQTIIDCRQGRRVAAQQLLPYTRDQIAIKYRSDCASVMMAKTYWCTFVTFRENLDKLNAAMLLRDVCSLCHKHQDCEACHAVEITIQGFVPSPCAAVLGKLLKRPISTSQ